MSENLPDPGHGQALVFQTAVTNVGSQRSTKGCIIVVTANACADLEGEGRGVRTPPTPLEFAKLFIADITGNEKIRYFSCLCTPQL